MFIPFLLDDDGMAGGAPAEEGTPVPEAAPQPEPESADSAPAPEENPVSPPGETQTADGDAESAPETPEETHATETAQEAAPQDTREESADAAQHNLNKWLDAEIRLAAALEGVSAEKLPYILRLCDRAAIHPESAETDARSAVQKVLRDIPELSGRAEGTGALGDRARRPQETEEARIREEIRRNL